MAQQHQTTFNQIISLWAHLPLCRKKELFILILLMIVASFAEVLSIGAVLPFLGVLTAPEEVFTHNFAQPIIKILQIHSAKDLLLPFTLIFIIAAIFAGIARIALLWMQTRLSMSIGADFSVKVYEHTLYQPYILHVSRNSSEILAGARKAEGLVPYIIQPVLQIISSVVILFAVVITLLAIQPVISVAAFLGFVLIYVIVVYITKRRILDNSLVIALQQGRVTKAIQEGLGGIRDVLIDRTQSVYAKLYKSAFIPMQMALASNQVVGAIPRFGVEALGMVLIAALAYLLLTTSGEAGGERNAIPVLGALALGAQRLLPVLQQIYFSYITIKGNQASTQDALDLLDQPVPEYAHTPPAIPITFQSSIKLKDLGFRYSQEGPWVLRSINLEILKGSRVGFIGVTGSGKSTVLDLLMALLTPTEGALIIDNTVITPLNTSAWHAHISHVPQSIFLADASIVQNIAFGVSPEQIDMNRVKKAAEQAQIANTIEGWHDSYDTMVGERGVRLSGGQRQRIGIARALYRQASVIILDEATSALDNETEDAVMQAVDSLNRELTILIIAHRLTTLKSCDYIVAVSKTNLKTIGGYEDIVRISS
jgi:ABC-type multidrug transport system fused ATPase/permease subunit